MFMKRKRSSGATLVEFALVLPVVIGLMFAGFFYAVYAVTQATFSRETARIAQRAVAVSPSSVPVDYRNAVCQFISAELDSSAPFYAAYVSGIKDGASIEFRTASPGQSVVTVRRSGSFDFLNSQKWGLPNGIAASGSALLPEAALPPSAGESVKETCS